MNYNYKWWERYFRIVIWARTRATLFVILIWLILNFIIAKITRAKSIKEKRTQKRLLAITHSATTFALASLDVLGHRPSFIAKNTGFQFNSIVWSFSYCLLSPVLVYKGLLKGERKICYKIWVARLALFFLVIFTDYGASFVLAECFVNEASGVISNLSEILKIFELEPTKFYILLRLIENLIYFVIRLGLGSYFLTYGAYSWGFNRNWSRVWKLRRFLPYLSFGVLINLLYFLKLPERLEQTKKLWKEFKIMRNDEKSVWFGFEIGEEQWDDVSKKKEE